MLKPLLFSLFACLVYSLSAQNNSLQDTADDIRYSNRKLYAVVQTMPGFQGGLLAQNEFIQNNLRYPDDAKAMNIQGSVTVKFIINQFGNLDSIEIDPYHHVWPSIDSEAIRVVGLTKGKWSIGMQNGNFVRVSTVALVKFSLPGQELGLIINPNSSGEQEKEAFLAYENQEYKKALQIFSSILEKDNSNYFALHNLGLCKYQTNDKDGACIEWTSLLDKGSYTSYYLYLKYCRPSRVKAFTKGRFISQ